MKDAFARECIESLVKQNRELSNELVDLKQKQRKTAIRYCPVCKHDTIQKDIEKYWRCTTSTNVLHFTDYEVEPDEYSWQECYCLTCGTKLKCTTKEVCEPCKPKK